MTEPDSNIIRLAAMQEAGEQVEPASEDGMALAFAERYADELRYISAWSRWLRYNTVHWQYDDTLHVFDRVRAICREIGLQRKTAGQPASAKTVAAVERLARSDRRLAATTVQWDANPWLLTTDDQTVDLRDGKARDPELSEYITKKAGCAAAPPGTAHPLWTAFLGRITDDDRDLAAFLQRYVGYSLTGLTREHKFCFAYGTGANGKGTFINTVSGILGDYATTADMATFIATKNERHPTDLAKLAGARLVVAQETQRGRRWDETKIKALTGGDRITARFMRCDFFDFTPTFKLFIVGNYKPRLGSIDEAMRRRLLIVPFTVSIPPDERDPDLAEKLKPEWPAILRWVIEGCQEWQRVGLAPPAIVRNTTAEYFAEQDLLQQWLDECVRDGGPHAHTRTRDLFVSWKAWCEDRNLRPGSERSLSEALADRGYEKARNGAGQQGFRNVQVK
jgi:putative DNA primase/helicase